MSDLIDRQDAIDAIHEDADWLAAQGSDWQVERMERDKSILMSLPSAHPVTHEERTKTHACDLISRQDAIDAIKNIKAITGTFDDEILLIDKAQAQTELMMLPSAEPRKKGKWIFIHPLQADDEGAYICSNCHRGDWDIKPTDKYCKFCGMAMDIYATLLP